MTSRRRFTALAACVVSVMGARAAPAANATPTPPIFGGPTLIDQLAPFPGFPGVELDSISCGSPTTCAVAGGTVAQGTASAGSASEPVWSRPERVTSGNIVSVSCPTASLCVAVTTDGHSLRSTDGGVTWSTPVVFGPGLGLGCPNNGICGVVSCPSAGLCVTGDGAGDLDASTDGGQTWLPVGSTPGGLPFAALSCIPGGVCAAIVDGYPTQIFIAQGVGGPSPPTWTTGARTGNLSGVSCTPNGICVASDIDGYAFVSTNVESANPTWSQTLVDGTGSSDSGLIGLASISCAEKSAEPSTDLCAAGDYLGSVAISNDIGAGASWSVVPTFDTGAIQATDGPEDGDTGELSTIACVSSGWCVAGDIYGNATYAVIPTDPSHAVWSPPGAVDGIDVMTQVSCASTGQLCAALDSTDHVVTSTDAGADWAPAATLAPGHAFGNGVSCVSGGQCLAVANLTVVDPDGGGFNVGEIARSTPTSRGATWAATPFDVSGTLDGAPIGPFVTGISCVDSGLCVAVDLQGNSVISTDLGATWAVVPTGAPALVAVSCGASTLCVAVGGTQAVVSADAGSGFPSWSTPATIDPAGLNGVSCTPRGLCMAVDGAGRALATTNSGLVWSQPQPVPGAGGLQSVSCTTDELCVATGGGNVYYTTNPQAQSPNWALATSNTSPISTASCVGTGLCVGVDTVGDAILGHYHAPSVALSGASGSFANTILGTSSVTQTVSITNSGAAPLNITSATLTGSDAGQFAISADGCSGVFVPPGSSCKVTVAFAPASTGAYTDAALAISSDAASSPDQLALSGTGVLGPVVSLSGDPAVFAATSVGQVSAADSVTATNVGGAPLHIAVTALTGADAAQFKLSSTGGCAGVALAPGASCTIWVQFAPRSAGAHTASLELDSDAPASPSDAVLSGMGTAAPVASSAFSLVAVKAGKKGVITAKVKLPRAGSFALSSSSTLPAPKATRAKPKPKVRRISYSRRLTAAVRGPTTATIKITPDKAATAALKAHRRLRVVVSAVFAAPGAARHTESSTVTVSGS